MCGIAGIISFKPCSDRNGDLHQMLHLMHHRGPDALGVFSDGRAFIGHNRLSILDLSSAASQPFKDDRFVLSYNGEIYNYGSLRKELSDVEFTSTSDTEVLFQALKKWGVDQTVKRIKGMFAFCWYDRLSGETWLVRDRYGIKPLFYALDASGHLLFASEMKALLPLINDQPNHFRLVMSVFGDAERDSTRTIWDRIMQLAPGSIFNFRKGSISTSTYYSALDDVSEIEYHRLLKMDESEVLNLFNQTISDSVAAMNMGDVPIGSFVSGGIDSSLISSFAREINPNMALFTADVKGKYSEVLKARQLAYELKAPLNEYTFHESAAAEHLAAVTWHYESPLVVHYNAIPFSGVASITRKHGVKAVLTGEGADELFIGYPHLLSDRFDRLIRLPFQILNSGYRSVPILRRYLDKTNSNKGSFEMLKMANSRYGQPMHDEAASGRYAFVPEKERKDLLLTYRMISDHLISLLWRNDRMGMMHSVESRFPFLDENLVALSMNLPLKYKVRRTLEFNSIKHPFMEAKHIVRRSAAGRLSRSLLNQPKRGFPVTGPESLQVDPVFFNKGTLQEIFQMNGTQFDFMLHQISAREKSRLAMVELWCRMFVQKQSLPETQELVRRHFSLSSHSKA